MTTKELAKNFATIGLILVLCVIAIIIYPPGGMP